MSIGTKVMLLIFCLFPYMLFLETLRLILLLVFILRYDFFCPFLVDGFVIVFEFCLVDFVIGN